MEDKDVVNREEFEAFCELQYPLQGMILRTLRKEKLDRIVRFLKTGEAPPGNWRYGIEKKGYSLLDFPNLDLREVLCVKGEESQDGQISSGIYGIWRRVAHVEEFYDILLKAHVNTLKHGGYKRLRGEVEKHYIGIPRDAMKTFISICSVCKANLQQRSRTAKATEASRERVIKLSCVTRDFNRRCQIDLMDMSQNPDEGYNYIGVYTDHWTKFVTLFPLVDMTPGHIAHALCSSVFPYFGPPQFLHSKQGKEFADEIVRLAIETWKGGDAAVIPQGKPSLLHLAETVEATREMMVQIINKRSTNENIEDSIPWVHWLGKIMFDINNQKTATGRSPYSRLFERAAGMEDEHNQAVKDFAFKNTKKRTRQEAENTEEVNRSASTVIKPYRSLESDRAVKRPRTIVSIDNQKTSLLQSSTMNYKEDGQANNTLIGVISAQTCPVTPVSQRNSTETAERAVSVRPSAHPVSIIQATHSNTAEAEETVHNVRPSLTTHVTQDNAAQRTRNSGEETSENIITHSITTAAKERSEILNYENIATGNGNTGVVAMAIGVSATVLPQITSRKTERAKNMAMRTRKVAVKRKSDKSVPVESQQDSLRRNSGKNVSIENQTSVTQNSDGNVLGEKRSPGFPQCAKNVAIATEKCFAETAKKVVAIPSAKTNVVETLYSTASAERPRTVTISIGAHNYNGTGVVSKSVSIERQSGTKAGETNQNVTSQIPKSNVTQITKKTDKKETQHTTRSPSIQVVATIVQNTKGEAVPQNTKGGKTGPVVVINAQKNSLKHNGENQSVAGNPQNTSSSTLQHIENESGTSQNTASGCGQQVGDQSFAGKPQNASKTCDKYRLETPDGRYIVTESPGGNIILQIPETPKGTLYGKNSPTESRTSDRTEKTSKV